MCTAGASSGGIINYMRSRGAQITTQPQQQAAPTLGAPSSPQPEPTHPLLRGASRLLVARRSNS